MNNLKEELFRLLNCYEIDAREVSNSLTYIDSNEAEKLSDDILALFESYVKARKPQRKLVLKRKLQLLKGQDGQYVASTLTDFDAIVDCVAEHTAALKQELKQSLEAQMPIREGGAAMGKNYRTGYAKGNNDALDKVQEAIDFVFQDKGDNRE